MKEKCLLNKAPASHTQPAGPRASRESHLHETALFSPALLHVTASLTNSRHKSTRASPLPNLNIIH